MADELAAEFEAQALSPESLAEARKYYSDAQIRQHLQDRLKKQRQPGTVTSAGIQRPDERTGFPMPGGQMVPSTSIDTETGAPFFDRFQASFKSSPADRLAFYKAKKGANNVTLSPAGEILIRHNNRWTNVEDSGISMGDLADIAGDVPEMLGMLLGGWRQKALKAGYGAMVGDTVKQGIGAAMPGDSSQTLGDRVGEVIKAGAGGALSASPAATKIGTADFRPTQMAREYLEGRLEKIGATDLAREGSDLNMNVNVKSLGTQNVGGRQINPINEQLRQGKALPLNVAEETADPWAKMILGFAYRNAFGQELAALDKMAKDKASLAMLKRLSGQLGKEGGFSGPFAESAVAAGRAAVKDIEDAVAGVRNKDFGFLKTPLGETRSIMPTKFNNLLAETAAYYEGMGTKEGLETGAKLRSMMSLGEDSQALAFNPRGLQDLMERLHDKGPGAESTKFYRNLRTAKRRELPTEMLEALKGDLAEAAKQQGTAGEGARALTGARGKMDELLTLRDRLGEIPLLKFMESKGMLNKALNETGIVDNEQIGKFLMEGMRKGSIQPAEIANMMKLLQATNPKFAHDFTRAIIDEAVIAGKTAGQKGIRASKFDYQAAGAALPKPEYLQAIYQDIWDPAAKSTGMRITGDLSRLMRAIERAETVGQGIPHPPGSTAVSVLGHLANMNFGAAGKQALSQALLPKFVANLALNPNARQIALQELRKAGEEKGAQTTREHFLDAYKRALPILLYEAGSNIQRQNRSQVGE